MKYRLEKIKENLSVIRYLLVTILLFVLWYKQEKPTFCLEPIRGKLSRMK